MNKIDQTPNPNRADVATVDDYDEMPHPPNTALVEWVITKIEATFRKRKEPGWSGDDLICLGKAVQLCGDREESIPRGVQKRFARSCGKLATPIIRHRGDTGWMEFGEKVRRISAVVDAALSLDKAIALIGACLAPDGARTFSEENAEIILDAKLRAAQFRREMPKRLAGDFLASALALERKARESYGDPDWIALARLLFISIPSVAWVRDAETAIATMASFLKPDAADSQAERELHFQRIRRVLKQLNSIRRIGPYLLPHIVASQLEDAAYTFVQSVVESPSAQCAALKHALRIGKTADGLGYEWHGIQVFPPMEYLP
ncbi:MAG TPA: hypothetical protein VJU77_18995 [Chthoniobacterales bacterium]|nr:hypothetical protein [Chthoniobacterales bacterium]